MEPQPPPLSCNHEGNTRRVGVEIEFASMSSADAAQLVCMQFGGQVVVISPHRMKVEGARWGSFHIELDSQYVHPDAKVTDKPIGHDDQWHRQRHQIRVDLHTKTRELIGEVVAGLVPTEIVCPPVPWNELDELDVLFDALRVHGAKGTDASLLYGFGLHLNPEVPSVESESILAHLRAYLLLGEWLRHEINVDITREMLPHANPFPKAYALKVLDPAYCPDLDTLIGDYIEHNPTRNRELDLLPLFAYLRPDFPDPIITDGLVKPRPTFHYRLPNAQLSNPTRGATVEWNLWLEIERLAADTPRLEEQARLYIDHHLHSPLIRWLDRMLGWRKES